MSTHSAQTLFKLTQCVYASFGRVLVLSICFYSSMHYITRPRRIPMINAALPSLPTSHAALFPLKIGEQQTGTQTQRV